jgi:Fic family protein
MILKMRKELKVLENRAGYFKSNLSGEMAYQSFVPAPLPPAPPVDLGNEGLTLLIQANRQLALLEGLAARIPNMDLFVSMYVRKEALLSSQIEGTQATLDDVLDPLLDENANRNVADVINYIKASEFAIKRLQELPLCNRLIKETHAVLMEGVRGQEKNPGEFRYSQNWIGGQGSTLKNARYIPPNPEDMNEAISDLEKYMNSEDSLDPLVRAALVHYQFETIHPFLDGNGRVGRLLITLFLMEKKILTTPALYISYFLKRNRIEYYDRMTEVRRKGNYEQWINFFLQAVMESAEDAIHTIDQLTDLHDKNMVLLMDGVAKRQADTLKRLFAYLEANPIIEIKKTSQALDVAYNTVARAVAVLEGKGILKQSEQAGKTRIYAYSEYLDILRKDT